MCMTINGSNVWSAILSTTVLPSGDIQVDLPSAGGQRQPLRHRGHGGHGLVQVPQTFKNLIGSDKAEFRFTDGKGNVVLDFYCDYITASSAFPVRLRLPGRQRRRRQHGQRQRRPTCCSPPPRSARTSKLPQFQTGYSGEFAARDRSAVGRLGARGLGLRQQLHGGREQERLRRKRFRRRHDSRRPRLAAQDSAAAT